MILFQKHDMENRQRVTACTAEGETAHSRNPTSTNDVHDCGMYTNDESFKLSLQSHKQIWRRSSTRIGYSPRKRHGASAPIGRTTKLRAGFVERSDKSNASLR
ncbi:hypothetical protein XU18_2438 [Perkinsela sp. CCAP 1560/4]|nr:hypothetical protein XU18_2438 [Perkinsela sp. CCAP 1560/4]|eukprot:KNH06765.1 hypothetical protein XU18_2438 [Perkinsela sp. CCAP 1560/4]